MHNWYTQFLWQKSMAWAHDEKRIAFKNIGKCASSSMKQSLEAVSFKRRDDFRELDGYKVFSIIREPIDRFVSGMFSVLANENSRRTKGGEWHKEFFGHKDVYEVIPIFIEYIRNNGFFDDHILPQSYTISSISGKLFTIHLPILFENLERDWNKIEKFVGSQLEFKHINRVDEYRMFPYCMEKKSIKQLKQDVTDYIMNDIVLRRKVRLLYTEDVQLYAMLKRTDK